MMKALTILVILIAPPTTLSLLVPEHFTAYSPLQKCARSKLPSTQKTLTIPANLMSNSQEATFRLREKCATRLPHCMRPCGTALVTLPISLNDSSGFGSFTPYGYFRYDTTYFSPDDICVESVSTDQLVLIVCPPSCSSSPEEENGVLPRRVCIPKCCSIHKALDIQSDSCQYTNRAVPWAPPIYDSHLKCRQHQNSLKLQYIQTQPYDCDSFIKYFVKPFPGFSRVHFRFLVNGSLFLRDVGGTQWKGLDEGSYCLDGVIWGGVYTGDSVLLRCAGEVGNGTLHDVINEDRLTLAGIAYIVLLFLGVPFLFITALLYMLVWSHQNVHGWTLFSHTLAMLLHYVAQAVANTVSRIFDSSQNASGVCMIVGILNHYFVLASFCWLTIINYDLYSMFRHLKTTVGRSRGTKRFIVYMCVAWGLPFVTVLVSVVLDNLYGLYGDDLDCQAELIVPLYGHRTCYMAEDARPFYLFYPIDVLMVLNLLLAFMTFRNMYNHDKSTKVANPNDSRRSKHRRKFSVMAKLFVVMGLVWVFELFGWSFKKPEETLPWYLVFPDVFNFFQAIAIFWLFACQEKVLGQVAKDYPKLMPVVNFLRKLNCKSTSPTAAGNSSQTNKSNGIVA